MEVVLVEPGGRPSPYLSRLVEDHPDLRVVARCSSAAGAVQAVRSLRRPREVVALVHVDGGTEGFGLIRAVREGCPAVPLLGVGPAADGATVSRALFFGADGFVGRVSRVALARAVRDAAEGHTVLAGVPGPAASGRR